MQKRSGSVASIPAAGHKKNKIKRICAPSILRGTERRLPVTFPLLLSTVLVLWLLVPVKPVQDSWTGPSSLLLFDMSSCLSQLHNVPRHKAS